MKFKTFKIEDVCDSIFSGGTPNTQNQDYWDGDLPWLSSGETRNTFIFNTQKTITKLGVKESSTRQAKIGDTLIASAGQGRTRGQTSYCLIDTYVNQSVMVLRPNSKVIEPLFLFYNLKSRYDELRMLSDSSSSRGSITRPLLEKMEISLPALPEQKKIVKQLYALDQKLINNHQQNELLVSLRENLLEKLISGEIEIKA